jgi:hypothetical protein
MSESMAWRAEADDGPMLIDRTNGRVFELGPTAVEMVIACLEDDIDVRSLRTSAPEFFDRLAAPRAPAVLAP